MDGTSVITKSHYFNKNTLLKRTYQSTTENRESPEQTTDDSQQTKTVLPTSRGWAKTEEWQCSIKIRTRLYPGGRGSVTVIRGGSVDEAIFHTHSETREFASKCESKCIFPDDSVWRTRNDAFNGPSVDFSITISDREYEIMRAQRSDAASNTKVVIATNSETEISSGDTKTKPPSGFVWDELVPSCARRSAHSINNKRDKDFLFQSNTVRIISIVTIDYDDFFVVRKHSWKTRITTKKDAPSRIAFVTRNSGKDMAHIIMESTLPNNMKEERRRWRVLHLDGDVTNNTRSNLKWDNDSVGRFEDWHLPESVRPSARNYPTEEEFEEMKKYGLSGGGYSSGGIRSSYSKVKPTGVTPTSLPLPSSISPFTPSSSSFDVSSMSQFQLPSNCMWALKDTPIAKRITETIRRDTEIFNKAQETQLSQPQPDLHYFSPIIQPQYSDNFIHQLKPARSSGKRKFSFTRQTLPP